LGFRVTIKVTSTAKPVQIDGLGVSVV